MKAEIVISQKEEFPKAVFEVLVKDSDGETDHTVTLNEEYYNKLSDKKISPEDLIKKSFEFLLEREDKESILGKFDLPLISHYFPEYEVEITK